MNHSLLRSADHDSQDKNLIGSLDQFFQNGRFARFGRFDFNPCVPLSLQASKLHKVCVREYSEFISLEIKSDSFWGMREKYRLHYGAGIDCDINYAHIQM